MLASSSNAHSRIDLIRTPTEVYLQRDCFCFLQMNINGVNNSQGKIKATLPPRDVPDGCMKKNTVSAKAAAVENANKHEGRHNLADKATDPQFELTHFMVDNRPSYYNCNYTVAKIPDRAVPQDDAKLYVASKGLPQPEIVDDKDIDSVEDTQEAVEEMEEGSDDGSSFFLASQGGLYCEENDGSVEKTQRRAARQVRKSSGAPEFGDELAATTTRLFQDKSKQYQEKLNRLCFEALHVQGFYF